MTARQAESFRRGLDDLLKSRLANESPQAATAAWVARLPERIHSRLVALGLAQPRERRESPTLAEWVDRYIEGRTDAKPNTIRNMKQAAKALVEHFGRDRLLSDVTAADADAFRAVLKTQGLAEATVRRRCKRARQFLTAAIKAKIVEENPFAGVPCSDFPNEARRRFIPQEDVERVIEICPMRWKVLFGLARFGGLRTPSEMRLLRWDDIQWDENQFVVSSPKTAGTGKCSRVVPLFPRLREILLAAFTEAEEGQEWVCPILRDGRENPRTVALRYVRRAGLAPWPRLFQNLRASLESELVADFPIHTVARWLGNTPAVAMKHYLTDRPEDFERAAEWRPGGAGSKRAQKRAHFRAQQASERGGRESQAEPGDLVEVGGFGPAQKNATPCDYKGLHPIPPRGLEPRSPG
jgi:integrase